MDTREREMKLGRPLTEVILTAEESDRLSEWARRGKTSQALAMRSKIVLAAAEGMANNTVAQRLKVTQQTVSKWRARSTVCSMNRVPGNPARSAMRISNGCWL
jgi:DNA-binding NarL/FixJ family response regulator